MAKLLLNLRGVPDDEADDIRMLLDERGIEFYETPPSRWQVSAGGIWIRRREDAAAAARLLAEYQAERRDRSRAEYRAAQARGEVKTLWTAVCEDPVRAFAVLLGMAFIVGVLALPFVLLGR